MAASVVFEEQVEIPSEIRSLAGFRAWAQSDEFPERGRIDYIKGRIEVDMSPEDVFCHGKLKGEIYATLYEKAEDASLGHVLTDSTRISNADADLSVEPDVVFISYEALATGRARLVPRPGHPPGHYAEIEGAPDLIVEIVSDSSVTKDTVRLPAAYAKAGVREFWLADARNEPLVFKIHQLRDRDYHAAEPDADGFQASEVFGCRFRLDGRRDERGHWKFQLVEASQ